MSRFTNAATTRSFLQVAATEEAAPPLRVVQIEGLVSILCFPNFNCSAVIQFLYLWANFEGSFVKLQFAFLHLFSPIIWILKWQH